MPISFLGSSSSPFDEIVDKATAEVLTSENWSLILEINDRVTQGGSKAAKDCLLSLKKRLNHRDPHVILLALSVLDSCVCNCGRTFQQEVCTREFISELKSKATGSNSTIAERTRDLIRRWSEEECKSDLSLSLMPSLYNELKKDGYEFNAVQTKKKTTSGGGGGGGGGSAQISLSEAARREEEELNKAIQLSLKENQNKQTVSHQSLYPSEQVNKNQSFQQHHHQQQQQQSMQRMVKALYDFEAAEDNELTFKTGELISVIDDSDPNWWKGSNFRGEGLFPASFVTADLNAEVDQPVVIDKKKSVQFDDKVKVENIEQNRVEKEIPKIDDIKLSRCLELLQNADPTGERPDEPELLELEEQCIAMAPLIEVELGGVDKQTNQLAEVNLKLTDALNLYHSAMREASNVIHSSPVPHYGIVNPNVPMSSIGPNSFVNVPAGAPIQHPAAYNSMIPQGSTGPYHQT